jgi:hypothetical protein
VILAIDPGIRHCGFALFDEKLLYVAGLIKNKSKESEFEAGVYMAWYVHEHVTKIELPLGERIDTLVSERPQVYTSAKLKGDPNDLVALGGVVGAIGSYFLQDAAALKTYLPREWKGQTPKSVTEKRVTGRLSDEEKARIEWPAAGLCHNVYDAIGIGLFHVGRGK